jgi:peptidoglycan L-alanyl-D-glutamate endopeptidase CwlK
MIEFVDVSLGRIRTLNPKVIESATKAFQKSISQFIPVYVVWASRTVEQQEVLYRSGRTMLGPIITARRPGYSAHNYGLGLDFCLLSGKKLLSWNECFDNPVLHEKWYRVIRNFEAEGWESGWRWPSFEPGHLQNLMGHTIGELNISYTKHEDRNNRDKDIREQSED